MKGVSGFSDISLLYVMISTISFVTKSKVELTTSSGTNFSSSLDLKSDLYMDSFLKFCLSFSYSHQE